MELSYYNKLSPVHLAVLDLILDRGGMLNISRINTPSKFRRRGVARRLLERCLNDADKEGVTLCLSINPYGGMDFEALEAWYCRNGFVESNTNFSNFYIRTPKCPAKE